jgi:hypothetical protein
VPILVGNILSKGTSLVTIQGAGNEKTITTEVTSVDATMHAEYVFIILGVIAIATAIMLFRSSKKNPQLGLDKPASK